MSPVPNLVRALVSFALVLIAPAAAHAGLDGKPLALFAPMPRNKRVFLGVQIDRLKREGQNGQITFNYSPAIRDGSSPLEYRDDLKSQFMAEPRFGSTAIPEGDFEGGLFLELAHLSTDTALDLVAEVLSGPLALTFDARVNFQSAGIVINWPRPEDGDVPAFTRRIEKMFETIDRMKGRGRSVDVLMTMDAAEGEADVGPALAVCNEVLSVLAE